jgi:hypothetical protein
MKRLHYAHGIGQFRVLVNHVQASPMHNRF